LKNLATEAEAEHGSAHRSAPKAIHEVRILGKIAAPVKTSLFSIITLRSIDTTFQLRNQRPSENLPIREAFSPQTYSNFLHGGAFA
jgi:hypothetical protein